MDTLFVPLELIGRNLVCLHVVGVTMASTARLSDIRRIGPRHLVLDGADSMDIMATDTDGNLLISFAKSLTMGAGVVFLDLICSNGWVERPHIVRITMALSAGFRDCVPFRFTQESLCRAMTLCLIINGGLIATVAALTAQSPRQMIIVFNFYGRTVEALFSQSNVAVNAGIRRLCGRDTDQDGRDQKEAAICDAQSDPHDFLIEGPVRNIPVR